MKNETVSTKKSTKSVAVETAPKAKKAATTEASAAAPLALKRFEDGVTASALVKAGGKRAALYAWHTDTKGYIPERVTEGPFAGKRFPCVIVEAAYVATSGTRGDRLTAVQAHMSGLKAVFFASLDSGTSYCGAPSFMSDTEIAELSGPPAKAPKAEKSTAKLAAEEPKKAAKKAEPLAVKAGKLAGKLVKSVSAR
jgi:hypothetical protein